MNRSIPLILVAVLCSLGAVANAHFRLIEPTSLSVQNAFGNPQKSAPCGLSDSAGVADESTPTHVVTNVQAGSLLTISINETIFHPGHFRVALAQDMAGLPADPPVTAASTACGSAPIDPNPALPVLGDGLLVHSTSLGSQDVTMQVQLPAGMQCSNCVLQVTQFMSSHGLNNPGGCYYHHCARVTITDGMSSDGGVSPPGSDAGTPPPPGAPNSGGCSSAPSTGTTPWVLGAFVVLFLSWRRRSRTW